MLVTAVMVHMRRGYPDLAEALRRPGVRLTPPGQLLVHRLQLAGLYLRRKLWAGLAGQPGLLNLYPYLNALLCRMFLGERPRPGQVAALVLVLRGTRLLAIGYGQAS
ncbi:hypothetical protein DFAR_3650007 [Desulfarculales bacterium]